MESEKLEPMQSEVVGRAKGGVARAEKLTPEQRRTIARRAAAARWGGAGLPSANFKGTIQIAEYELPCFVLDDGRRVISGRGMTSAIGMKGRGQGTARIASLLRQKSSDNNELALAIESPLVFDSGAPVATQGFEARVLVQLCEALLNARDEGTLKTAQEQRYGEAAYILTRAFARVGIIALVDEATGYQEVRDKKALQAILDQFLRKEFAAWAKRFPDEFYQQIFRLRGWTWKGMKVNRPQVVAKYTKDLVYARLAPGVLNEIEKRNPIEEGARKSKHHQWLTDDLGVPALSQHLHAVVTLMRVSESWDKFKAMIDRALPKRGDTLQLDLFDEQDKL